MSPPGLRALQAQISTIGLDKFRALDDQGAEQFYNGVFDKAGLTPARLSFVYQYIQCKQEDRMDFVIKNQACPDFLAAFSYVNYFLTLDDAKAAHQSADNSIIMEMMARSSGLQSWDAKTDLQKTAMAIDGKITPVSYAKAYGSLMNQLDSLSASADIYEQMLFRSWIVRLKKTYFETVATTDYVLVNQAYGVDILKAEPFLQKLIQQDKTPAPVYHRK
jgi:hypothetical protein